MLTKDEFVMELCGNKAAWQIVPENLDKIDLAVVGARIVEAGYEIGVSTRLCWTFFGPADLTLFPSGKLMVKTEDKAMAQSIARQHLNEWVNA